MKVRELKQTTRIDRPIATVFSFFADPTNLEVLTPPWLRFEIVSPQPIEMRAGTRIDYRLRLRGFPVRWQSEIIEWEPPHRFVDVQRRGPYRLWRHEHRFAVAGKEMDVIDFVRYAVPLDFLTYQLLVRPDIERIFEFRRRKLQKIFPASR